MLEALSDHLISQVLGFFEVLLFFGDKEILKLFQVNEEFVIPFLQSSEIPIAKFFQFLLVLILLGGKFVTELLVSAIHLLVLFVSLSVVASFVVSLLLLPLLVVRGTGILQLGYGLILGRDLIVMPLILPV